MAITPGGSFFGAGALPQQPSDPAKIKAGSFFSQGVVTPADAFDLAALVEAADLAAAAAAGSATTSEAFAQAAEAAAALGRAIRANVSGVPFKPSEVVLEIDNLAGVRFPAGAPNARVSFGEAATAETVFSIRLNGVQVATATVAAGQTLATISWAADTVLTDPGDVFSVVAPSSADATLANGRFTFPYELI